VLRLLAAGAIGGASAGAVAAHVVTASGGSGGALGAAGGGAGASAAAGVAASLPVAVNAIALKLTLIVALGAGGGALGWRLLSHQPSASPVSPRRPAPASTSRTAGSGAVAPLDSRAQAPAPAGAPPPEVRAASVPAVSAAVPPVARRRGAPGDSRVTADPVLAELRLIERARAALAGDPARALQLCRAHAREFPRAVMSEERDAMVISALISLRRFSEARARQASFVIEYPESPHERRLRERLQVEESASPAENDSGSAIGNEKGRAPASHTPARTR